MVFLGYLEGKELWNIIRDWAKITCTIRLRQSPVVERSKVTPYYNMGSLSIVQPRELSRCPIVQVIIAQSLKEKTNAFAVHHKEFEGAERVLDFYLHLTSKQPYLDFHMS